MMTITTCYLHIRRTLPLPSSSVNNNGGRSKKKATGSEFLSHLRAIANREVTNPGAGVRLFVQACVLSGCDYVANRLSKVGPIGAFKLVKENAHRDPSVRFVRILRGAKIAADVTSDKDSEDCDDDFAGDDFLDSMAKRRISLAKNGPNVTSRRPRGITYAYVCLNDCSR